MKLRIVLLLAVLMMPAATAGELTAAPLKSDGVYAVGDKVGWTVTPATPKAKALYTYTVRENGGSEIGKGSLDLTQGPGEIALTPDHPMAVYVTVDRAVPQPGEPTPAEAARINTDLKALTAKNDPSLQALYEKYPDLCLLSQPCAAPDPNVWLPPLQAYAAVLGAVVSPANIAPVALRPADFDAFWADRLKVQAKIPMNAVLTALPAPMPGIKFYRVKLDAMGSHVQGYLAIPDKKGPFPAMIQYQWAGVYALIPWICANRAAEGWLCFNVVSHDMAPESATGVPQNYPEIGNTSRETSYFLNMYLRDTRALDWVRTLPSWNKKALVVTGGSMGGQQSLVTAGLNPGKVTAVVVVVPAGGDSNGALGGRMAAYPFWPVSDPKVAETAPYFDTANFASRITAPTMIALGLIDSVCPPSSTFSIANRIPAPKEIIPMPESDHNNYTPDKEGAFYQRSEEVFATILHGGKFKPNQRLTRPEL
jgi:cephalosporin-C deacetylase-like acetyl esterase